MFKAKHLLFITLFLFSFSTHAKAVNCIITYYLSGWSFFYKEYSGTGTVHCNNGQSTSVSILSRGGGITFGKSEIKNGKGVFSKLYDINEIYGTYVAMDAHAGLTESVEGQAMTKGEVSLALSGRGRGVDFGFSLAAFTIKPR
jgi:hypothetical protein